MSQKVIEIDLELNYNNKKTTRMSGFFIEFLLQEIHH
jgi:hypothetical protein